MQTDFWFRAPSPLPTLGLYISTSMGNPASVRNTWLGIVDGGEITGGTAGAFQVAANDVDSSGNFIPT